MERPQAMRPRCRSANPRARRQRDRERSAAGLSRIGKRGAVGRLVNIGTIHVRRAIAQCGIARRRVRMRSDIRGCIVGCGSGAAATAAAASTASFRIRVFPRIGR